MGTRRVSRLLQVCTVAVWISCSSGGNGGAPIPMSDTHDLAFESPLVRCGDGVCDPGEECWRCPKDCRCYCGDGVCTHGESCSSCSSDCDCDTLAATPPMGWNSWNRFRCDIDEDLIREVAEALVSSGMADAGYRSVNLDDCWQVDRDAEGRIVADPERFPSGIAALAEYVHSLGLRFGIYTCAGTKTCQERPGSYGYEEVDLRTYAEWGVDFVKVDWCYTEGLNPRERYAIFRDAIAASGRPMVFSICNWGLDSPWVWGPETGHLWRTSPDIFDAFISVLVNFELTVPWAAFAGAGHWNDPDMLEVGNGGMTTEEYRAHMSLWAILSAPLIAGNDVRDMDSDTRDILLNPEVIAVNQDPLGLQGVRVLVQDNGAQVIAKPVALPGGRAVVLFNPTDEPKDVRVRFEDLGLAPAPVLVRDLWERSNIGSYEGSFSATVQGHGARMLLLRGVEPEPQSGETFVSDLPFAYAANSLGPVERGQANGGELAGDGKPIRMSGIEYSRGLGVHAASRVLLHLGWRCSRLLGIAGLDDTASTSASVRFEVLADGRSLFRSDVIRFGHRPIYLDVPIPESRFLELRVDAAGDDARGEYANWADVRLVCD